jgi:hypothetical protein
MKKRFLNFYLLFVVGVTATAFISCKSNEPDEPDNKDAFVIRATNVLNASNEIDIVTAEDWYSGGVIAEAPFRNNGFVLNLPQELPAKHTRLIKDEFAYEFHSLISGLNEGKIIISDENAKCFLLDIYFEAYDKNNNNIGWFSLGYRQDIETDTELHLTLCSAQWIYADRDVTVKIKENAFRFNFCSDVDVELNLKKGWNTAYFYHKIVFNNTTGVGTSETISWHTGQKPAGIDLKWQYVPYAAYKDYQLFSTKRLETKKSFFKK